MTERIGILVGQEQSFPQAFIAKVNETPGFRAEFARVGGTPERFVSPYRVLVDRISHEVPFYRFHLKAAALGGAYVINDPFWWSADDKFFGYSLAAKIGVTVPRTVMLPPEDYIPSIDPGKSLRNLEYPLDWEGIANYVGFPAILKPADGGGWKNVSPGEQHGGAARAPTTQSGNAGDDAAAVHRLRRVRALHLHRQGVHPPHPVRPEAPLLPRDRTTSWRQALEHKMLDGAWALNHALGYDMNSVEFAIKDGVPYAIDFTNPAPDMDVNSILPKHFHMVVDQMAKFAITSAREGRTNHDGFRLPALPAGPPPSPGGARRGLSPPTRGRP